MIKKVFNLQELLAPIIGSRDITEALQSKIMAAATSVVALDFTGVEFLSRSAAHQFLMLKDEVMHEHDVEVLFENTNNSVREMFRVVAANRAVPKSSIPTFNPQRVSIDVLPINS